jgi:High potential iron-sulfur protein
MSLSRRMLLGNGAILLAAVGASSVAWSDSPPMVSETDPLAVSLGYRVNATSVDKAKFPQYTGGQSCSNCALYQGAAGASSGPCPIFSGKSVSSTGWCASYSKKG